MSEHTVESDAPEPTRMGSLVRDRDGDLWKRGRTRWNLLTPVDGERITNVGRLPWYALRTQYGPLTVERVGPAPRVLPPGGDQ